MAVLKESIILDRAFVIKVHLHPMPRQVNGEYPLIQDPSNFPDVAFSFYDSVEHNQFKKRDEVSHDEGNLIFIKKLNWEKVFTNYDYVALKGSYHLTRNDVAELDSKVWEVIGKYGLYPVSLDSRPLI